MIKCAKCGSENLQKFGKRTTKTGTFQQYRCKDCRAFTVDTSRKWVDMSKDTGIVECSLPRMRAPRQPKSPAPQADSCMLSYPTEHNPMGKSIGGFVCALSLHIQCAGTPKSKEKCPLWSGTARIF